MFFYAISKVDLGYLFIVLSILFCSHTLIAQQIRYTDGHNGLESDSLKSPRHTTL